MMKLVQTYCNTTFGFYDEEAGIMSWVVRHEVRKRHTSLIHENERNQ